MAVDFLRFWFHLEFSGLYSILEIFQSSKYFNYAKECYLRVSKTCSKALQGIKYANLNPSNPSKFQKFNNSTEKTTMRIILPSLKSHAILTNEKIDKSLHFPIFIRKNA